MFVHTLAGGACRVALRSGPVDVASKGNPGWKQAPAAFPPVILLELDCGIEGAGRPAIVCGFGHKWEQDGRPHRYHGRTSISDVHRMPSKLPIPLLFGDPGKDKDNGVPYRSRRKASRFFGSSLISFDATVRGTTQPGAMSYRRRENRQRS